MYGSQPWTDRLWERLEQGPVEKEQAVSELIGFVPPGQAWRTYYRTLLINRRKRAERAGLEWEEPDTAPPTEEGIRAGARQIVIGSINGAKRRGRVEEFNHNGRSYYRKSRDVYVPTQEELSERARKGNARLTPEQRSERSRRQWEKMTPEERSERARRSGSAISSEVQSRRSQQWWDNATEEEKAERARRVSEGIRRSADAEERSRRARERADRETEKTRRKRSKSITEQWRGISEEERSERARKGVETRRRRGWFREGAERTDDHVPEGPQGGVQPDQREREGRPAPHHAQQVGRFHTDERRRLQVVGAQGKD